MKLSSNAVHTSIDIVACMVHAGYKTSSTPRHLQQLKKYIIPGWPANRNESPQEMRPYWIFRDDLEVIDGMLMEGRCIIIPDQFQRQALVQIHSNTQCIYWFNMNANIENTIKHFFTCLDFEQTQPKEKIIHHKIPGKPLEVTGPDVFQL